MQREEDATPPSTMTMTATCRHGLVKWTGTKSEYTLTGTLGVCTLDEQGHNLPLWGTDSGVRV